MKTHAVGLASFLVVVLIISDATSCWSKSYHSLRARFRSNEKRRLKGCKSECKNESDVASCIAVCRASNSAAAKAKPTATLLNAMATENPTKVQTVELGDSYGLAEDCELLSQTSKDSSRLSSIVTESLSDPFLFTYDGGEESYIIDGTRNMFNGGNAITNSETDAFFDNPCRSGYLFGHHSPEAAALELEDEQCCSGYWFDRTPYTKGEVVQNVFGSGSSYYTVEAPGIFALSVKGASVDWVKVNGMTGHSDEDDADVKSYDFDVSSGGVIYRVIVKSIAAKDSIIGSGSGSGSIPESVAPAAAPTIIHIWIFPGGDCSNPLHQYPSSPNCDNDRIDNPGSTFDFLVVAEQLKRHPTQESIAKLVERYVVAGT